MGFYSDFFKINGSGNHSFDAIVLLAPAKYTVPDKQAAAQGAIVQIAEAGVVVVDDILVHTNGRKGEKDLALDTVVLPIEKLAAMPEDLQAHFFEFERTPSGYRKDSMKPVPEEKK